MIDAHVAAAALAAISQHGGTATITTSDIEDMRRLLDAADDASAKTSASIQAV